MTELTISEFPHDPPDGYSYSFEWFNKTIIAIWLNHHQVYDYNLGKPVSTIWGFYHSKRKEYYAPINSAKKGNLVDIQSTTPYTSMQVSLTPLEKCFL
jgi:hypothetical protein